MSAPLTSIDTGGGVWRLKWHPSALHKVVMLRFTTTTATNCWPSADSHTLRAHSRWCWPHACVGASKSTAWTAQAKVHLSLALAVHHGKALLCSLTGTAKSDTAAAVQFNRLLTNNKHGAESLAYGVDWIQTAGNLASAQPLVASCSFYNHELRLWRPSKALF